MIQKVLQNMTSSLFLLFFIRLISVVFTAVYLEIFHRMIPIKGFDRIREVRSLLRQHCHKNHTDHLHWKMKRWVMSKMDLCKFSFFR